MSIKKYLGSLLMIAALTISFGAMAAPEKEDCAAFGSAAAGCDLCYGVRAHEKAFPRDHWLTFKNPILGQPELILGTASSRFKIESPKGYVSHPEKDDKGRDISRLVSNIAPAGDVPIVGFVMKNVQLNSRPASRDEIAYVVSGEVFYRVTGGIDAFDAEWLYTSGEEQTEIKKKSDNVEIIQDKIHTSVVSLGKSVKYYNAASQPNREKTCQFVYISWCGDGVRDAPTEQCDPEDKTKADWGAKGCSRQCVQQTGLK